MVPFHKWFFPPLMEFMKSMNSWVECVGIDSLFFFNRTKIYVYHFCDDYYTRYPAIRLLSDTIYTIVSSPFILARNIALSATYRRLAQSNASVNIYHVSLGDESILSECCNIKNQGKSKPYWFKVANDFAKGEQVDVLDELESSHNAGKVLASLKHGRDVLVVARQNPVYIITAPDLPLPKSIPQKSHVEFFVVQYMHPHMKQPIHLHVPQNMMYVGNALFRPAFVLWLLEQEPVSVDYVFDEHYVLTVMDHNIEERHFSSDQYIVLGTDDYEVNRISY